MSFPDQHEFSMKLLRNSGSRHLKKVHDQERQDLSFLSFLIVSFEESSDLVNCFASRLADAYTHGNFEEIDSRVFKGEMETAKKQLDDAIIQNLEDTQKVLMIKNIEKLSFVAAQLFMTYSDAYNTIATYPRYTIILTANLPVPSQGDCKEDEKQVSTYFKETLWKDQADINSVAALWAGMGDSLAVLKHVEKNPCKENYK